MFARVCSFVSLCLSHRDPTIPDYEPLRHVPMENLNTAKKYFQRFSEVLFNIMNLMGDNFLFSMQTWTKNWPKGHLHPSHRLMFLLEPCRTLHLWNAGPVRLLFEKATSIFSTNAATADARGWQVWGASSFRWSCFVHSTGITSAYAQHYRPLLRRGQNFHTTLVSLTIFLGKTSTYGRPASEKNSLPHFNPCGLEPYIHWCNSGLAVSW